MRKLDNTERKHVRSTVGAMLSRGEHKDEMIHQVRGWLISPRGWPPLAALLRAREAVALELAKGPR